MRVTNCLLLFSTLAFAQSDAFVQGLEAFHKGDYVHAELAFRDAAKPGGDARAATWLALTLAATGRCKDASPALNAALNDKDANVRRMAGLSLVQCAVAAERLDDARDLLKRLRASDPISADVLYEAARVEMRAWNATIRQLYEKAPSSYHVNQISAEILETQGQYAEAAAEYRKAIQKCPQALNLHFRLARALLMSSHAPESLDAALKEIDAELAMNPYDAVALYQAAQIEINQQRTTQAATRLQRALELLPSFPEALLALGRIRLDEKKPQEAIELLKRAVTLAPKSEPAHYSLMLAYRNAGRIAEAKREKALLDELQKTPEGEFSEFLKKLGEQPAQQQKP